MAVYVDALVNRGWSLGPNCHLLADTEEELHAFAASIGMRRSWFQPKSTPHYDLTRSRRAAAVKKGAVELNTRQTVEVIRLLRRRQQKP